MEDVTEAFVIVIILKKVKLFVKLKLGCHKIDW